MFFSLSLKSLKDLAILCYGKPESLSIYTIVMVIYIIIATSLSIFSVSLFKPINHFRVFSLSLKSLKDLAILCYDY